MFLPRGLPPAWILDSGRRKRHQEAGTGPGRRSRQPPPQEKIENDGKKDQKHIRRTPPAVKEQGSQNQDQDALAAAPPVVGEDVQKQHGGQKRQEEGMRIEKHAGLVGRGSRE